MSLPTTVRTAAVGAAGALLLAACSSGSTLGTVTQGSATPSSSPTATPSASASTQAGVDPALAPYYAQKLSWSSCGGSFQCAAMTVPLDYAQPTGETIKISVLRLRSSGGGSHLGSLVTNPGGPGGSGVDFARAARSIFPEQMLAAYDVVGFDPRGVQRSDPVTCLTDAQYDDFIALDGSPDTPAEVTALEGAAKQFAQGCEQRSAKILAHVSTADSARDMDVLRAALGDKKLNYVGFSYGTLLGATYADLFPKNVGRMVLDGAVDPALGNVELQHGQAKGFELALKRFVENCDQQSDCPLPGGTQAGLDRIAKLFADTDATPLPTDDPKRPLTQALAQGAVLSYLYFPAYGDWDALRQGLAAAFDGDGTVLLQMLDERNERSSNGKYANNLPFAYYAVSALADPDRPTTAQTATLAAQWEKETPILGSLFAWANDIWQYWPVAANDKPHALTAKGAPPILVVGTTYDPATPYPWAQAMAKELSTGVLLTRVGDGHTGYGKGSACTDNAVDRFMLQGTAPAAGTVCR
ncbi:MAG TPA: alpha/beta hydrolase [Candidatus Nanopelagicales bacterium]|nr:alpha/beta hydrolase [Candidatus Nanopelagicales bacterium]